MISRPFLPEIAILVFHGLNYCSWYCVFILIYGAGYASICSSSFSALFLWNHRIRSIVRIYIGWCVLLSICILYSRYFKALQCISIIFCWEDDKLSPVFWFDHENDKQTLSSIKDALCDLSSVVFSRLIFHPSRKRHILANSLLYPTERVTFPSELLHLLF